jgi:two-component system, chemotaxis family, protein-glutamate methylesterase/glutaminase
VTGEGSGFDLVVIGASAGGFDALCRIVSRLPADFSLPIAAVQHRAKESELLAKLIQDCTALPVVEVEDKQPIEPGTVYIAPPDYHLLVEEGAFALSTEGLVGYSRPSIDVCFESAADVYGPGVIGVVLTGANADGARGLKRIVEGGGQAIVQDPSTAEVAVMPASAQKLVARARVMSLDEIAEHLIVRDRAHPRRQRSGVS